MLPLTVAWSRQTITRALESRFMMEELLGGAAPLRHVFFTDPATVALADDMLIVILDGDGVALLERARQAGIRRRGVFHMGDERGRHDLSFYQTADYVLRHYYHRAVFERDWGRPVAWMPNGYRNGVGPCDAALLLPASQRRQVSFFAGMVSGESAPVRQAMIDRIRSRSLPCDMYGSKEFGGGFPPAEYAGRLQDSVFGLCPPGQSTETIRIYDCLEHGTIPIVLAADYLNAAEAMAGAPFPVLSGWEDLDLWLGCHRDLGDPSVRRRLDDLQAACVSWWRTLKADRRATVARLRGRP